MVDILHAAIQKAYKEYQKEISGLLRACDAVSKKIAKIDKKYAQVLALMKAPRAAARSGGGGVTRGTRIKRGTSRELILGALRGAEKPMRASELIAALKHGGSGISGGSVRQALPRFVAEGVVRKTADKGYWAK